jgi:transcriptional regulator with XRE-family HTH domain
MNSCEELIGKNIKEVRKKTGLSQEMLAMACGFSNTTLSAYENGRKIPNLITIAKIAKELKVSIERLYYGDENSAFINSESDEGKKIVNAIYYLWETGTISYHEKIAHDMEYYDIVKENEKLGVYLYINRFGSQIKRLILSLNEFKIKRETYSDPDKYLEILLSSVATEINNEIESYCMNKK